MFRAIEARLVVGLILIGLGVGAFEVFTDAQEIERQPGDYFWQEVSSGTVGALAGGLVTAIAGVAIAGYLYGSPCNGYFGLTCRLPILEIAEMAFLIGDVVGGAVGVFMTGSFKRVQGNILLAFTGAIAGAAVALVTLGAIEFFSGMPLSIASIIILIIAPFLPLSTALGATLGYNINAKVEPVVLSPTNQGLVLVGLKTQLSI